MASLHTDLFVLNKIFFLKKQLVLFVLLFFAVFFLGMDDAFSNDLIAENLQGAVPQIGHFVGLPANTKSDYRWEKIEPPTAATRHLWSGAFDGASADEVMEQVNTWVNSRIRFVEENKDDWSSANRTLARGYGDCEDVSIAKYQILKSLGFAEDQMFLVVARDQVSRQDHAFLLVRSGDRNLILDNLTNMLIPDSMVMRTYFPVFAYGKNGSWVFGIKKSN